MAETIPMVQEAENFSAENSKDTIVSLENHDENIPNIVRITKKRELIKRFTVEKRRSTISVFIITGISILLLTTIISWLINKYSNLNILSIL
uniref:Uncharacterized protein n=1 Tax=Onchocerca volvulus TaxID=6282 RepID=A0A8R1XRG1_ONCVO